MAAPLKGLIKALGALDKLSGGSGGWGANVEGADVLAAALEEEFEDWEFTTGYAVGASASYDRSMLMAGRYSMGLARPQAK